MLVRIAKSIQIGTVALRQYPYAATVFAQIKHFSDKADETTTNSPSEEASKKLGSFAKAFKELEQINEKKDLTPVDTVPFKKLLRQSKLVDVSHTEKKFYYVYLKEDRVF